MSEGSVIGEVLARLGVVDAEARERAAAWSPERPTRFASRLWMLGLADEADLVRALAIQQGVPGVDLSRSVVRLSALSLVPRHVAEETLFLPLDRDEQHLYVAMANPQDTPVVDELQFISGRRVVPHVALQVALRQAIGAAYDAAATGAALWAGNRAEGDRPRVAAVTAEAAVGPPATPRPGEGAPGEDAPGEGVPEEAGPEEAGPEVTIEVDMDEGSEDAPSRTEAPGSGRRVLVVDDEEEIRNLLTAALGREGYRVETAGRGREALRKVKTFDPELVLLDAMLPEVHGFDICRRIRDSKRFAHVPVVMISAVYRGWRYAQDVKDVHGATDFIEKPFRIADVVRRVAAALDGAEAAPTAPEEARERAARAYRRGVGMLKVGKVVEAVEVFREGIEEDPFAPALHYSLARALEAQGDAYGAMASYERAVDLRSDLFPALKRLGVLYEAKGFRRKAVEAWERALPVAPDVLGRELARDSLLALLERPFGPQ